MDWNDFVQGISTFGIPLIGYFIYNMDKRFDKIDQELKEIRTDIKGLDNRISHMEGILWATHGHPYENSKEN